MCWTLTRCLFISWSLQQNAFIKELSSPTGVSFLFLLVREAKRVCLALCSKMTLLFPFSTQRDSIKLKVFWDHQKLIHKDTNTQRYYTYIHTYMHTYIHTYALMHPPMHPSIDPCNDALISSEEVKPCYTRCAAHQALCDDIGMLAQDNKLQQ